MTEEVATPDDVGGGIAPPEAQPDSQEATVNTIRRNRHLTVSATVAGAAASWAVVTQVAGVHLGVRFPHSAATTVALGPVIGASVTATLLGWVVLAVMEPRVANPRRNWTVVALAVAAASLALPAAFATTLAAAAGLASIHMIVAAVAITGMRRSSPAPAAADGAFGTTRRRALAAS